MVYKRPFHDEESYEIACKHLRQQEYTAQQSPSVEIATCNDSSYKSPSDGEGGNSLSKSHDDGRIPTDMINEDLNGVGRESAIGASGSISNYLWVNSNAIDEYAESEAAVHLSFFPNYFELDPRVRAFVQPDEIYSAFLDHPPRKLVSVGPEYQADVPDWAPQPSDSCFMDDDINGVNLLGTCVIPMPDLESPAFSGCLGGEARSKCNCLDKGSVGCVKQHVMQARDELRENLGEKIFEELGLCDMGEEVAKRWSEDEEQAFHAVVLSNPASLGRNFWDHLPAIFPTRTKKDLVSYYFNVFMLRKRAEQNRFDPLIIDSDNDEWQRSEFGLIEEDDDSVVESPVDQDAPAYNPDNHEEDFLEGTENEDDRDADFVNRRCVRGEEDEGDIEDVSDAHTANFIGDCCLGPVLQGKISKNDKEDQDIQDDSCTSYEYRCDRVDSCGPVDLGTVLRESNRE